MNTHESTKHTDTLKTAGESVFGSVSTEESEWSSSAGSIPLLLLKLNNSCPCPHTHTHTYTTLPCCPACPSLQLMLGCQFLAATALNISIAPALNTNLQRAPAAAPRSETVHQNPWKLGTEHRERREEEEGEEEEGGGDEKAWQVDHWEHWPFVRVLKKPISRFFLTSKHFVIWKFLFFFLNQ